MVYLRARHYNPADGRFMSRDTWEGDVNRPMSMNRWGYVEGNPIIYTDPSGYIAEKNEEEANNIVNDLMTYSVIIKVDWGYQYVPFLTQCGWNKGGWISQI